MTTDIRANPKTENYLTHLGIRYIDDVYATTDGSSFPENLPGTVDWYSLYMNTAFTQEPYKWEDSAFMKLEEVANRRNELEFVQIANQIDWENCSEENIILGVKLAMASGAHLYAQKIVKLGIAQFPDHAQLNKFAYLLAGPRVLNRNLSPDLTLLANRNWLKLHQKDYKGNWVALGNGILIASAPTLKELRAIIGRPDDILITKVG